MKLCYSNQMRDMDRLAIEEHGIPGVELMSVAAQHIAEAALERLPLGGCAAVFCGTGNNGGDGIGAAACLIDKGVSVRTFLIGDENKLTPDSKEMLNILKAHGGAAERFSDSAEVEEYLSECDVIIDAVFGIGLNSELRGEAAIAVSMINSSAAFVIAADIPSGVHADTGAILRNAVNANITVTFTYAKPGHFVEPGCIRCGEVRVRDIGIPSGLRGEGTGDIGQFVYAVTRGDVRLPHRRPDSHKGDYGRCLILAGSVGYTGAPALCARAASRMGAGLVFLGVPEPIYHIMAVKLEEEMPFPLPCDREGRLGQAAADELLRRATECDVCLVGPGLGRSLEITELVTSLIHEAKAPIVLDADGLNAIADNLNVLGEASCPMVLTPHLGEFARLGGELSSGDRLGTARDFAQKHGCILVLKGHRTITALPDGTVYINTTGSPAMAKGGSGDVLAGMIAALIGQKIPINDAVVAAVYIHGLAGDMCAAEYGEYSVTASDIIGMIPKAILSLQRRE